MKSHQTLWKKNLFKTIMSGSAVKKTKSCPRWNAVRHSFIHPSSILLSPMHSPLGALGGCSSTFPLWLHSTSFSRGGASICMGEFRLRMQTSWGEFLKSPQCGEGSYHLRIGIQSLQILWEQEMHFHVVCHPKHQPTPNLPNFSFQSVKITISPLPVCISRH